MKDILNDVIGHQRQQKPMAIFELKTITFVCVRIKIIFISMVRT